MSEILTAAQIGSGLMGKPPKPFRKGRRLELLMDNNRLVRGVVLQAGKKVAQLEVGWIPADGGRRGYAHINLIVYAQVRRWKVPKPDAPAGTWMPEQGIDDATRISTKLIREMGSD